MMGERLVCPRCGGTSFAQRDCGPDGYDDDIVWTSDVCQSCGLWRSGWSDKWLLDVDGWPEEEDAEEFTPPSINDTSGDITKGRE